MAKRYPCVTLKHRFSGALIRVREEDLNKHSLEYEVYIEPKPVIVEEVKEEKPKKKKKSKKKVKTEDK
jgi:hypothetical protein